MEAAGLYAIAQEALTNIARHSGAREAAVRLDLKAAGSCLEIEDRGRGFDVRAASNQPGHLGLAGMAERGGDRLEPVGRVVARPGHAHPRDHGSVRRRAMKPSEPVRGYQGSYLIGFLLIAVAALRLALFYRPDLLIPILLIAIYTLLYASEPWLSSRIHWYRFVYFPVQTGVVIALSNLRPFTDFSSTLYIPLCIQVLRGFPRRARVGVAGVLCSPHGSHPAARHGLGGGARPFPARPRRRRVPHLI